MLQFRRLLRLVPALLVLLLAAAPAPAAVCERHDLAYGAEPGRAHTLRSADRTTVPRRDIAVYDWNVGIDDDSEKAVHAHAVERAADLVLALIVGRSVGRDRAPPPPCRSSGAPPTGPPHA